MKTLVRKAPEINLNETLTWWGKTNKKASELARWLCLYEAVNLIGDKAEERGKTIDDVDLPPLDIMKYIEATENLMTRKILQQEYHIDIYASEDDTIKGENYEEKM